MTNDYDLYGGNPPHQAHSDTSFEAAKSVVKKIGPMHQKILDALKLADYTDEALQISLDMSPNTERPRRRELQLMGKIEDSGKRVKTKSGRNAVVWRLV